MLVSVRDLIYCLLLLFTLDLAPAAQQRTYDITIQRLNKVMVDHQYIDLGTLRVTRINRTHTVISGIVHIKMQVDDDVLVTILLYEKSGTEYKRSAAGAYKNKPICSLLNSDAFEVHNFKAATNFPKKCPIPPGTYEVKNYVMDPDYYPAYIPGSYWRGDVFLLKDDIQWGHIQIFAKIDQKTLLG